MLVDFPTIGCQHPLAHGFLLIFSLQTTRANCQCIPLHIITVFKLVHICSYKRLRQQEKCLVSLKRLICPPNYLLTTKQVNVY